MLHIVNIRTTPFYQDVFTKGESEVVELQSEAYLHQNIFRALCLSVLFFSHLSWAETEREAILRHTQIASWAYYTDSGPAPQRWYISQLDQYEKVDIFSLGPLSNGLASWWTVKSLAASTIFKTHTVIVDSNLDTSTSDTFYDVGLRKVVTNSKIHSDRLKIQGQTVPIKWYFFQAPNGYWYIVSAPGYGGPNTQILRFSSKNDTYDWVETDTKDLVAVFTPDSSGKMTVTFSIDEWRYALSKIRVGDIALLAPNISCLTNSCSNATTPVFGLDAGYGYNSHAALVSSVDRINNKIEFFHARSPEGGIGSDLLSEDFLKTNFERITLFRVKDIGDITAEAVVTAAKSKYKNYSYSLFWGDENTYCSDLVARAYSDYGYNLRDQDKFGASGSLITSGLFLPDELSLSNQLESVTGVDWPK